MVPLVLLLVIARMAAADEGPAPTRPERSPWPPAPIRCSMLPLSAAVAARPARAALQLELLEPGPNLRRRRHCMPAGKIPRGVLRLFWTTETRCWCWNRPVL